MMRSNNMEDNFWQHPYVDVFKHYNIGTDWKRTEKKGDVKEYLVTTHRLQSNQLNIGKGNRKARIQTDWPHFIQQYLKMPTSKIKNKQFEIDRAVRILINMLRP